MTLLSKANIKDMEIEDLKKVKINESLRFLADKQLEGPIKIAVAFAMYNEQARIQAGCRENPNGEDTLRKKIEQLIEINKVNRNIEWELIAVDDGEPSIEAVASSRDIVNRIYQEYPELFNAGKLRIEGITYKEKITLKSKKGGAITKAAQMACKRGTDYFIYTDADVSTDLRQLGLLLMPALREAKDVVIGSRRIEGAVISKRSFKELLMSTIYNRLVRIMLPPLGKLGIQDTQCGFKLFNRKALEAILVPERFDNHWSFDTEWLLLALLNGNDIKEVPIAWIGSQEESKLELDDILIMSKHVWAQRLHIKRVI